MTEITFTNNISPSLPFSGVVKIKVDDMERGDWVQILEERVDETFEEAIDNKGNFMRIEKPHRSALFELHGNYKVQRSSDSIAVGYES